jgi:hypothetical protein
MNPREHSIYGTRLAGTILLTAPMLDVVLGGVFGAVHAVVGTTGLVLVVPAMLGKEA